MHQLLVTANVPSSPILVALMVEVLASSKTLALTRTRWHNIPEDGIIHSHYRENVKCNIVVHSAAAVISIELICMVLVMNIMTLKVYIMACHKPINTDKGVNQAPSSM
jgi:hypothetical protein